MICFSKQYLSINEYKNIEWLLNALGLGEWDGPAGMGLVMKT